MALHMHCFKSTKLTMAVFISKYVTLHVYLMVVYLNVMYEKKYQPARFYMYYDVFTLKESISAMKRWQKEEQYNDTG